MVIADTNIWIDYFNDPDSTTGDTLRQLIAGRQAALAGVVMTELIRGARNERQRAMLKRGFQGVRYVEMTEAAWTKAGSVARQLDAEGRAIQLADTLLAGLALTEDHEVYTRDKHFERIPGLRLYKPEGEDDG